jgi:hypothetical protein
VSIYFVSQKSKIISLESNTPLTKSYHIFYDKKYHSATHDPRIASQPVHSIENGELENYTPKITEFSINFTRIEKNIISNAFSKV